MRDSVRVLVEECGARLDQVRLGMVMMMMMVMMMIMMMIMIQLLNGDTSPLYLAAQRGYTELAVQLLGYGADVNFVMPRGEARGDIIAVGGQQPGGRGISIFCKQRIINKVKLDQIQKPPTSETLEAGYYQ